MGTDRLFLQHRNGAQPVVLQYVNSTPTQLGNAFGTTLTPSVSPDRQSQRNMAAHFCGEVYAVLFDGVYRFNQGPSNFPSGAVPDDWSNLTIDGGLPFTDTLTANDRAVLSGLYVANINGDPHLVGVKAHSNSTTSYEGYKLNSVTGLWSESGFAVVIGAARDGGAGGGIHNSIVYRNVLHFQVGNTSNVVNRLTYDSATDAFALIPVSVAVHTTSAYPDYCVFQDRLFMVIGSNAGGQPWELYEFTGGVWTASVVLVPASQAQFLLDELMRVMLFTDGTNMYAFILSSSGGTHWVASQFDPSLISTDISTTVLPSSLTTLGVPATDGRFELIHDFDSNPALVDIKFHFSPNATAGTSRTTYQWNGNAATITSIDVGGNVAHACPNDGRAGGERFFTAGQLDAKIVSREAALGGEKVSFKVFGDPVVLLHGTVTAGPFQVGEIITGGTSGATGTVANGGLGSGHLKLGAVTGTFQNAELLTGGTSGATATTTAGPTGGAADKNTKIFFTVDGEPTLLEATLIAPVTGGAATLNVGLNRVENVVADGATIYTIVWAIGTDSVSAGDRVTRYPQALV